MNIDEIEKRIRESVSRAQADGWTIVTRCSYPDPDNKMCCPLSALDLADVGTSFSRKARAAFGLVDGSDWPWDYACGFDGGKCAGEPHAFPEAFELGRKHRQEWLARP